jgi:O-antigen/teichoic acid export membrane protein
MTQLNPITTSKRLMSNTVLNMTASVITTFVNFYLITFFLSRLGELRYGIWVLIASIFQYRGILSMGLNSAINRYIPVYLAQDDDTGIGDIVSTSFFFLSSLCLLLVLLSGIIYFNFNSWFVIQPELIDTARVLVLIVGFSYALSFPLQISSAILSGIQRYDIINSFMLAFVAGRTILLVVLLFQGYGLLTMGLVFGGSEMMERLLLFFYSKKLLPQATVSVRRINFKLLWESTAYGTNLLLYTMGSLLLFKLGYILIGIFLDSAQISHFSIAVAPILALSGFTEVFSSAVKPAVSDLDARADTTRVSEIAFLTQKYTLLMLIPASCFFVVMARDFLGVWVGGKIQDAAVLNIMASVMAIMTIAHTIRLVQYSNVIVLAGRGEHRIFGFFSIITAALFVVIAVMCLKVYHFGLIAVAWSGFFPVVLISGIILPFYCKRRLQTTFRETAARVWVPALSGTLPAVALIVAWKFIAAPQSWVQISGVIASTAIITGISSWFMSLSTPEHKRLIRLINRK